DKDDFDTHRVDDEVDIMNEDRLPGANLEQPRNEEEAAEMVGVAVEGSGSKVDPRPDAVSEVGGESGVKGLSKEERKRRKKERRKEELRRKGTAQKS
ncbi:MAG: hypothetical protein M1823_006794, partial [Watsoniomyces obsoletus]